MATYVITSDRLARVLMYYRVLAKFFGPRLLTAISELTALLGDRKARFHCNCKNLIGVHDNIRTHITNAYTLIFIHAHPH